LYACSGYGDSGRDYQDGKTGVEIMKLIIAGTRTFCHTEPFFTIPIQKRLQLFLYEMQEQGYEITEVVSGCARGPDLIGEDWAKDNHIAVKTFPADWVTYGDKAGPIRNQKMAEYADACIVFWDGSSTGTGDMIKKAKARKIPCRVIKVGINLEEQR
jgi:hypothetical protein